MIHPHTKVKFISSEVGHGVVATEQIPAGTITWINDKLDREFSPEDLSNMEPVYREIVETYTFRNNKGNFIFCWDHGRYVNHSFKANCIATAYGFEVAVRDIEAGEELTNDYGFLNIVEPFKAASEGTKRKYVYPDDLLRYHSQWDKKVEKVLHKILQQPQPLRKLVDDEVWEKIKRVVFGEEKLDSVLLNLYRQ